MSLQTVTCFPENGNPVEEHLDVAAVLGNPAGAQRPESGLLDSAH